MVALYPMPACESFHPQGQPQVLDNKEDTRLGVRALYQLLQLNALYHLFHVALRKQYLLFLVLDKVVGPFLEKYLEMTIWHPKCERTLDELLEAQIDV